jgi:hypothetical protein
MYTISTTNIANVVCVGAQEVNTSAEGICKHHGVYLSLSLSLSKYLLRGKQKHEHKYVEEKSVYVNNTCTLNNRNTCYEDKGKDKC